MDSMGAGPRVAGPGAAGAGTAGPGTAGPTAAEPGASASRAPEPGTVEPGATGRIEDTLLGGQRRYTRVQVSEATGVDRDRAQQLWMAMGFAEVGDDEAVFTDGDVDALRTWDALVASGTIAREDEVAHARVM